MAFLLATIGELLWDVYKERRYIGGSPANVAIHVRQTGADVLLISRIGPDQAGDELIDALRARDLDMVGVQRDPLAATGQVQITVAPDGTPAFRCSATAAFDGLCEEPAWKPWASEVKAVYFTARGSRHPRAAAAIIEFLRSAPQAVKFFDANFSTWNADTAGLVDACLNACDIAKFNSDEMHRLMQGWGSRETEPAFARWLLEQYRLKLVIITNGADGCLVTSANGVIEQQGYPVAVKDTTGCGDAFAAAFLLQYVRGQKLDDIVNRANALAAFVATREGAVPPWRGEDLDRVMAGRTDAGQWLSSE